MHHNDAPGLDPRTDIADLYVFQAPDDASKAVLVLNVNPKAGDVVDHVVEIMTRGKMRDDRVRAHTDYLTEFPYLGTPHER
jgi:hypothetical protein